MRSRNGFTLVELLIAAIILVIVVTGTAKFAGSFARAMSNSTVRVVAVGVANDRLQLVRSDPRYTTLTTLYGSGAGADTTGFPSFARMRRITTISRDQSGNPARDRTTITVRVIDPSMPDTVSVTTVIASP